MTDTQIKAIDTVFDGHRFRSRLEARWAVFFKERGGMTKDYHYEEEGYTMPNGMKYLPDFSFTDNYGRVTYYAEVKPEIYTKDDIIKPWNFVLYSGTPLILLNGIPRLGRFPMIFPLEYLTDEFFSYGFTVVEEEAVRTANYARFEFGEAG